MDCSSGPENQSSPLNADTEDTPELPQRSSIFKNGPSILPLAGNKSEKKLSAHPSSGRGEISRKSHADNLPRRVQKRRRPHIDRDVRLALHHGAGYDSDSDSRSRPDSREGGIPSRRQNLPSQPSELGTISSIFHFIEKHPNLPHILTYYAQFLLNFFFVILFMYLFYLFLSTIRSDVDIKSRDVVSETVAEIVVCAREFKDNRCDRSSRVPAMETVCDNWEKCMNRDPSQVGRAKVSAETFAGILSNFIDNLSVKTMVNNSVFLISPCCVVYCLPILVTDFHCHLHPRRLCRSQQHPNVLPPQDPPSQPSPCANIFAWRLQRTTLSPSTSPDVSRVLLSTVPKPHANHPRKRAG